MQNINFTLHFFFHAQLFDLGLVQNLDRYLMAGHGMSGQFDLQLTTSQKSPTKHQQTRRAYTDRKREGLYPG
jgi:hypothetical protein